MLFEPTLAAAQARLAAVRPGDYARTRNSLAGAVTRLSPYLTHGFMPMPTVVNAMQAKHHLPRDHKLLFEFAWREFFHHAWRHDGEGIFTSLHAGVLPDSSYSQELPADIRSGCTGIPAIDRAVRELYTTGYIHNHARMWLASYIVHMRKVHWRVGADWLYAHLLDGDLASNHLSWQWVAGTGSHKPYLFNAENVAKYAPPEWHCPGSGLDTTYADLDALARNAKAVIASVPRVDADAPKAEPMREPTLLTHAHTALGNGWACAPSPGVVQGKRVWLAHAWALGPPPPLPSDSVVVVIFDQGFHARWLWSAARWRFIQARVEALAPHPAQRWWGTADQHLQALQLARSIEGSGNLHLGADLDALGLPPMPRAFADTSTRCSSFSTFWQRVNRSAN